MDVDRGNAEDHERIADSDKKDGGQGRTACMMIKQQRAARTARQSRQRITQPLFLEADLPSIVDSFSNYK
jgi:hypothetical protein